MTEKSFFYQINDWKIDPISLGITHRRKGKIKIQNKVAEVLIVLLKANGELVTKDNLYEKVWGNSYVTENSLNKAVSELRKIFNDSRTNPKYIETVSKKGYRFIATYQKIDEPISTSTILKRKSYWLSTSIIILLLIAISFFYNNHKVERIESVISPDGEKIAFIKKDSLFYGIFIHNLISDEIEKIISFNKPESFALGWSPNNKKIVYSATQENNTFYAINVIDIQTKRITYIKFAKNPQKHKTESLPVEHSKPIYFIDNYELKGKNRSIDHIYLNENDTIKVLFEDKLVKNFSW